MSIFAYSWERVVTACVKEPITGGKKAKMRDLSQQTGILAAFAVTDSVILAIGLDKKKQVVNPLNLNGNPSLTRQDDGGTEN